MGGRPPPIIGGRCPHHRYNCVAFLLSRACAVFILLLLEHCLTDARHFPHQDRDTAQWLHRITLSFTSATKAMNAQREYGCQWVLPVSRWTPITWTGVDRRREWQGFSVMSRETISAGRYISGYTTANKLQSYPARCIWSNNCDRGASVSHGDNRLPRTTPNQIDVRKETTRLLRALLRSRKCAAPTAAFFAIINIIIYYLSFFNITQVLLFIISYCYIATYQ